MKYSDIKSITFYTDSTQINLFTWRRLRLNCKRANKPEIHKLLKRYCPEWYNKLELKVTNPYYYHKTAKYIIVTHSNTEYFFKIEYKQEA